MMGARTTGLLSSPLAYGIHTSQVAGAPLPQLAGEGGAIGRRETPVFRRAMAPDGVWPAASGQVGLHDRHRKPASIHSCFPHPIRRHSPSNDGRLSTPYGGTFPASRRRGTTPGACRFV